MNLCHTTVPRPVVNTNVNSYFYLKSNISKPISTLFDNKELFLCFFFQLLNSVCNPILHKPKPKPKEEPPKDDKKSEAKTEAKPDEKTETPKTENQTQDSQQPPPAEDNKADMDLD